MVLRVVQFAFANLSARVGQVFFSEEQAFPFIRFRTNRQSIAWSEKVTSLNYLTNVGSSGRF
jgi:hypothetical protein